MTVIEKQITTSEQVDAQSLHDAVINAMRTKLNGGEHNEPTELYDRFLADIETPLFDVLLAHNHGNLSKTAKQLGMSRSTLRKKLRKHGLKKA